MEEVIFDKGQDFPLRELIPVEIGDILLDSILGGLLEMVNFHPGRLRKLNSLTAGEQYFCNSRQRRQPVAEERTKLEL
jgi:hypothetical protein